jgi:hypothetical protein
MSEKTKPSSEEKQKSADSRTDRSLSTPESKPDAQTNARLQEDIDIALKLPLPEAEEFWRLEEGLPREIQKGIFSVFKKKEPSYEELNDLRNETEQTPGIAMVKIQALRKKHSDNPSLIMLNAICTTQMVMSSSNRKEVLESMKTATKNAAYVLINDGISLFNCQAFFEIYFNYLAKIKRFQATTYKRVREDFSNKTSRKNLIKAFKICENLLKEKDRVVKLLAQIKRHFKSSGFTSFWRFFDIQSAGKKVEARDFKAICGPAEAKDLFMYALALTDLFTRVPILNPLVGSIVKLIPGSDISFILRKKSLLVSQAFSQINIAILEENIEQKRSLGRFIYSSVKDDLHRLSKLPIKQDFEAQPYFFLSRVILLTFGSYNADEQEEMLLVSITAMKQAAKLDMSKNHQYKTASHKVMKKLSSLMPKQSVDEINES